MMKSVLLLKETGVPEGNFGYANLAKSNLLQIPPKTTFSDIFQSSTIMVKQKNL